MRPGKYNIKVKRGSTFNVTFTANVKGVAINFETTYDSARLHVRPAWVNSQEQIVGTPLLAMTTANGGVSFAGNTASLYLSAAETQALQFESGSYLLELVKSGAVERVDPFLEGLFEVDFERTV